MKKIRALSVRQPFAEQIMRGTKKKEYRSIPTRIRGEIYIYASLTPAGLEKFKKLKLQPDDLPTGSIVGTVELYDCKMIDEHDFVWLLRNPKRLKKPLKPDKNQKPQPVWFYPFGKIIDSAVRNRKQSKISPRISNMQPNSELLRNIYWQSSPFM